MEIERKFVPVMVPEEKELAAFSSVKMTQGYLCTDPVVRVRQENDSFVLTYKGAGLLAHEEYNLPLTEEAFRHLLKKCDGRIIEKTRYRFPVNWSPAAAGGSIAAGGAAAGGSVETGDGSLSPLSDNSNFFQKAETANRPLSPSSPSLTAELDLFSGELAGLVILEVEFPSLEDAVSFTPPAWFGRDVTEDPAYHNSAISRGADPRSAG